MATSTFSNARIMIIDDQAPNVMLLEKLLQTEGYAEIKSVLDAREAVQAYREFQPDLVLLDLMMPHMDGYQVMEQLQQSETGSWIPVLVLTADNSQQARLRALASGAKDFLSKPFDLVEVRARIRNMLEVRVLQNQLAAQNQLLEQKVKERTRQLEQSQLEVIQRLARAADFRDDVTGLHTERMARMAHRLALEVDLPESLCRNLLQVAPMHDVGKIGIPDAILMKPGRLTPDEWATMKTHVEIGATLLAGGTSELVQMAHEIALTHHEDWNGQGYPHGLAGEAIPLTGRLCRVADVFDALTSDRPYKQAWSVDEAAQEIERSSGKCFDPRLLAAFKRCLPDLAEIVRDCR